MGGTAGTGGAAGSSGASGSGGTGQPCVGASSVVDWGSNYSIDAYGSTWSVGDAPLGYGPEDGATYLATVPPGTYSPNVDATVMLATYDLSELVGCQITMTFDLWRETESGHFDGGNLQITTDPDPDGNYLSSNNWQVVGEYPGVAGSMNYDATSLVSASCAGCFIAGQPVWSGSQQPQKSIKVDLTEYAGAASATLRFTFHSNGSNSWDGLYIGNIIFTAQ